MQAELTIKGDVEVLRLQPGDTLVLTVDGVLNTEQTKRLVEALEAKFPGRSCVVLDNRVSMQVARGNPIPQPEPISRGA
jgi:hypothetical protein